MNSAIGPIEQIIVQATPLCNLNCSYCYLPEWSRAINKRMSIGTIRETFLRLVESGILADEIDIRWHAGEPLVLPPSYYEEAFDMIKSIVPKTITLFHSLQTNATLINDEWCQFILDNEIRVGVSIDGPEFIHDTYRLSKGGKGTHASVVKGINKLQQFKVPFEIISVITSLSLDYPKEIFDFYCNMNPTRVAFNIEESECEHSSGLLQVEGFRDKYRIFFSRIYELQKESKLKIREIEEIKEVILYGSGEQYNLQAHPFAIVTVDFDGNIYTYSPELTGMSHPDYSSFACGNIKIDSFELMKISDNLKKISDEVEKGINMCRSECEYFSVCGGGAPGNKLYENGTFASTETGYCIARYQIPTDIVLEDLENSITEQLEHE